MTFGHVVSLTCEDCQATFLRFGPARPGALPLCTACRDRRRRAERKNNYGGGVAGDDVYGRIQDTLFPGCAYHTLSRDERQRIAASAIAEQRASGRWPEKKGAA